MAESFFGDKSKPPTVLELEKALGKSNALLKNIEAHLHEQFGDIEREWKFYSKKAGWTFALVSKGRRLLHLIPRSGFFTAVITLGKKAIIASETIGLPSKILSAIENAKEYAEGKSIQIDISLEKDILPVKQLILIKMNN
jgi:hypothetical protein